MTLSSAEPVEIISRPLQPKYAQYSKTLREKKASASPVPKYKWQIVWKNVLVYIFLHYFLFHGGYLLIFRAKWATAAFSLLCLTFSTFGVTAGAHRLWSHRTYTANFPLRLFLMLAQSAALQNHIYEWARDHRVHHKFVDTDADPHNSNRGFFFSHVGWLLMKKHKDVFEKGKTIDMSDLEADPLVRFQRKYYVPLALILCFVVPSLIPWYYWNENGWISFSVCIFRYCLFLNGTWLVNSAAHMYGVKPFDKTMNARENLLVATLTYGEGFHNYHHTFPWDYKAAELGNYRLNMTTALLDLMAKIGWATELKTASVEMVRKRALRTGDGSWSSAQEKSNFSKNDQNNNQHHDENHDHIWGWGDKDMVEEEKAEVKCYNSIK